MNSSPAPFVLDHPLADHHVRIMRSVETEPVRFRGCIRRLTALLIVEATRDLSTEPVPVTTPLTETQGGCLTQRIGLIPILRAGLGMVDPVLDLIPEAEVWHLGFYRDEETLSPVPYYEKLPPGAPVDVALILDPMLATGGSALAALETLKAWGVPQIKLLAMLAAPEGIRAVRDAFPDAQIYIAKVDEHLNDRGYIVPGLGDAGDRIFNTKA